MKPSFNTKSRSMALCLLALSCLLLASAAWADDISTVCYGLSKSPVRFIYLHGWDDPDVGPHERENRRMIEKIATVHGWGVAVVRGRSRCNKGRSQCWTMGSPKEVQENWNLILKEAQRCFSTEGKLGTVGFSNGGYLIAAFVTNCITPQPAWGITFGSAASGTLRTPPGSSCFPLRIVAGQQDSIYKKAQAFATKVKKNGGDVEFVSHDRGHLIDEKILTDLIRQLTQTQKRAAEPTNRALD
jgi:hypothetical protein